MAKNMSNEKVRLIMAPENFNTVNAAVLKFVNSCTEPEPEL